MSDDEREEDPRHASPRLSQGRGDNEARARVQSERSKAVTEANMNDLAKGVRSSLGGAASDSSSDGGASKDSFGEGILETRAPPRGHQMARRRAVRDVQSSRGGDDAPGGDLCLRMPRVRKVVAASHRAIR